LFLTNTHNPRIVEIVGGGENSFWMNNCALDLASHAP